MLNKKKYTLYFVFILGLLLLSACQKAPSASNIALNYYDLIIKQNSSAIVSLGMSTETAETIISQIKENLRTQISEKLSMDGRVGVDNSKVTQIADAYLASLQKLQVSASTQKEDNHYLVTLSTSHIDYTAIDKQATDAALKEVAISQFTDEVLYLSTLTNAYISHLITGYQNAEPSATYNESTFVFTSQNGLWLPSDYDFFVTELCNLVSTSNELS